MSIASYDAVIFDLDGTLIDSRQGVQESIELAVRTVLPDRETVDFSQFIGPPIKRILKNALADLDDGIIDLISKEFRRVFDSENCLKSHLYPGVAETLSLLTKSGIVILMATNKPRKTTDLVVTHLEIGHYFNEISAPEAEPHGQESKEVRVRELVKKQGLDPRRILMVGDTEEDWSAARSASIGFAACLYGFGLTPLSLDGECLVLNKITELTSYIFPNP